LRYFIELSYKGARYHGWQRQKNALSVQEVLERAFSIILRQYTEVTGCGRTDTGVHAHRYIAHFDTELPIEAADLLYRVNAILPEDIALYHIFPVADDLHARFSAVARTYRYFIHTNKEPFLTDSSYYYRMKDLPDLDLMNDFCRHLPDFGDFTSFEKFGANSNNALCNVSKAFWTKENDRYVFEITSNRFLRNMVRAITGTCLMIGTQRVTKEHVLEEIRDQYVIHLLLTAPAHGLHLWKIEYPDFSTPL
jgi:tRNA pseudouridine38-40 synthase